MYLPPTYLEISLFVLLRPSEAGRKEKATMREDRTKVTSG